MLSAPHTDEGFKNFKKGVKYDIIIWLTVIVVAVGGRLDFF